MQQKRRLLFSVAFAGCANLVLPAYTSRILAGFLIELWIFGMNWRNSIVISTVICIAISIALFFDINRIMARIGEGQELPLPFAEIAVSELDKMLQPQRSRQLSGRAYLTAARRNRLIVAEGTFECANRKNITDTLKRAGFASTNYFIFMPTEGANWRRPTGSIVRQLVFERKSRSYDQLKLFELADSKCVFQFQST